MLFKHGSDLFQVQSVNGIEESDAVRIAHVHAGDEPGASADLQRVVEKLRIRARGGNLLRCKLGSVHFHRGGRDLAVPQEQLQMMDAADGFNGHGLGVDETVVVHVLGHAAYIVSRHAALAAVTVEGAHPAVRRSGLFHEHNAVAADAVVRRAQTHAQGLR